MLFVRPLAAKLPPAAMYMSVPQPDTTLLMNVTDGELEVPEHTSVDAPINVLL